MPDGTGVVETATIEAMSVDRTSLVWARLRAQAETVARREPVLAARMRHAILDRSDVASALAMLLADKLAITDQITPPTSIALATFSKPAMFAPLT
jgi:hypothetical protein